VELVGDDEVQRFLDDGDPEQDDESEDRVSYAGRAFSVFKVEIEIYLVYDICGEYWVLFASPLRRSERLS
jgi:hypothetical protein